MQAFFWKNFKNFSAENCWKNRWQTAENVVLFLSAWNRLGEMSERFKEPVLKTGDVQTSVGSNPTLSAIFSETENRIRNSTMRKYPRGRRGSPAKGVGCVKSAAEVQILSSAPFEWNSFFEHFFRKTSFIFSESLVTSRFSDFVFSGRKIKNPEMQK